MPSSTVSCTPLTASHSTARPCANQRKKPESGASLTPTTPSEPLNPSTGELSAIIGMLSAIDRNQCPQSIGTPVRNPRNPQLDDAATFSRLPDLTLIKTAAPALSAHSARASTRSHAAVERACETLDNLDQAGSLGFRHGIKALVGHADA